MMTVLFSSAGRRVELMQAFREDAGLLGLPVRVLAADCAPVWSPACAKADQFFAVPECGDPEFIPAVLRLCERERVGLVVPTIDPELQVFADRRAEFEALGVQVAVSSPETVRIARSKLATAAQLAARGVPTPKSAAAETVLRDASAWSWPLVVKPMAGSGSQEVRVARTEEELAMASQRPGEWVVQEYCAGREFTVNLFFDRDGRLRCAVPHWRKEVRGGEVSKAVTWRHPALARVAREMAAALPGARGPVCFQAMVADDGRVAVFDLNVRFGGGFPLAHRAGARFPLWLMQEAAGRACDAHDDWQDRLMMLRHDCSVFQPAPEIPGGPGQP